MIGRPNPLSSQKSRVAHHSLCAGTATQTEISFAQCRRARHLDAGPGPFSFFQQSPVQKHRPFSPAIFFVVSKFHVFPLRTNYLGDSPSIFTTRSPKTELATRKTWAHFRKNGSGERHKNVHQGRSSWAKELPASQCNTLNALFQAELQSLSKIAGHQDIDKNNYQAM
jgi:hypothetical protein